MELRYDPNLVLYLPLYELDGASFLSRDKHGHLATVTGALWRPQGRDFDGIDDKISVPYHSSYDTITELTALAWLKPDILDAGGAPAVARDSVSPLARLWKFGYYQNGFYSQVWGANNGSNSGFWNVSGSGLPTYTAGTPHLVGISYKSGAVRNQIVDGEIIKTEAVTGSLPQSTAIGLTIGSRWDGSEWYNGLIGEVWIYNRLLSVLEIQRNYLATKWRYQ